MPTQSANVDWRRIADALAETLHAQKRLAEPEVGSFLRDELPTHGGLLVLCSGGADSVATALWAATSSLTEGRDIGLFYCDHGTRVEAAGEKEFVRSLAEGLGFAFHYGEAQPDAQKQGEADLRQIRETALRELLEAESGRYVAILTGHQADDVAENLLFRLARGSGLAGLSGMRPVQERTDWPVRLRPLLRWPRAKLRKALREAGAPWCDDVSNLSGDYARNRLRRDVLPALDQALPERSVPRPWAGGSSLQGQSGE